jgi:hypothetical protein
MSKEGKRSMVARQQDELKDALQFTRQTHGPIEVVVDKTGIFQAQRRLTGPSKARR